MLVIRKRDKIKLSKIKQTFKNNFNINQAVKGLKWQWAEHLARLKDGTWTYKIKNWILKEGRR